MQELIFLEPGRLDWRESDSPRLEAPEQAIVSPLAIATCDLDRAMIEGASPFEGPFTLGHEMIGEVVEVGDAVRSVGPRDRVAVPFQISCGECEYCRRGLTSNCKVGGMYGIGPAGGDFGGAFAERVRIPFADAMLLVLPKGIDPLVAASAPDNISDAWRAVVPPLESRPGGKVLILAGPGANSIPLYAVQIARAAGAGAVEVLTRSEQLAPQAERLGAEVALVEEWPDAHGRFDVVVENANERRGLGCALRSTRTGGHCTVTSLHAAGEAQIPIFEMYLRTITLTAGRANSRVTLPPVLELISTGSIDPALVTSETASWDEAPQALLGYTTKLIVDCAAPPGG